MMNFCEYASRLLGRRKKTPGVFVGRRRTHDVSIQFRMGAGQPGDVNRTHPASIPPFLLDPTNPPTFYGQACVINTSSNGLRTVLAGDTALTDIDGITVRPYPIQDSGAGESYGAAPFGSGNVATSQPVDALVSGYIMVKLPAGQSCTKGGAVYVWVAATTTGHVQGGFESQATGGSTIQLTGQGRKIYFNSPADANGVAELAYNV